MKNILILISIASQVVFLFTETSEVRYDLVLIESPDGIGFTYNEPREILLSEVEASSTLSSRYSAYNLIDNDPSTTWIEGAQDYGLGETITFKINSDEIPLLVAIWPGYQKTPDLFERNARPSRIKISWQGMNLETNTLFEITSIETDLIHNYSGTVVGLPQYIYIGNGPFIQNMDVNDLVQLQIEILDVDSRGSTDPDTCISEIKLYSDGPVVGFRALEY